MKIIMQQAMRLVLLIACGAALYSLTSCDQTDCKYYDDAPPYLDIQSMSVNANDTVLERDGQYPFPFYVTFSGDDYYYATIDQPHFSFPLLKSVSACPPSPRAGYKGSKEKLDSIQVNTLLDFNEEYPKGSRINEHFFVRVERDSLSIDAYLDSGDTQLDDYVSLHLKSLPDTNRLKCAFLLQLENGETYRDTSRTIYIE